MSRYSYCGILVTGLPVDGTQSLLDEVFERRMLTVGDVDVEVRRNPDARNGEAPSNDFVRWPVQIEVEPVSQGGEASMVETVSRILEALWGARGQAVAACDFEGELPWSGGIGLLEAPTHA
ncbi:hypothetical protein [Streptomyces sp. SID9727]|uniref:hypothetical protein n=1 Tax=Streptomyces sp. SID9727 TaxID=2706114 RepID=UPI0013CB8815|nr:hypothetical protein [Streptomyces sp. SID9727]NEC68057.1 hypothetical protein [Streptomyces sp. SID9727]